MEKEPFVVKIHDVHIEEEYVEWVNVLKTTYRKSQIRAAVKVNSEKLLWNWQLGRDLVQRKAEERWGTGIVEQLSLDLQAEFPDEKGFSTSNIWYMKRWYLFYANAISSSENQKLDQLGQELYLLNNENDAKLDQLGQEINDNGINGINFPPLFAFVPWRHHIEIIKNCTTIEEAIFYIQKTINEGLSRSNLTHCIKADLFHKQAGAVSNFPEHLPVVQDIFFEPDTFLDGLGDIILHNFLISLVQRYDISEMKLAFDEIFKLSLLSPFQSAEESEEYAFFNIESSLLGI